MIRPPVRINSAYEPLYDIDARYIHGYGGRNSGKSYAVSQLLTRKGCEYTDRKILVMRKYATSIRLSVWARIKLAIDEAIGLSHCQVNKSTFEIYLPTGSMFVFLGADDPQKLKSLEGITDIWLEEANEFDEIDFNTLDAGLRAIVEPQCQIWFTYNPIPVIPGTMHWLQEVFLQVEHKLGEIALNNRSAVLRTWYKNNAFCPKVVKDIIEGYKETNPELYRMWGLGEFTILEGVILDGNWDIVKAVPKAIPLLGYGLDFGFANDPAAVVKVHQRKNEIWLEEKIYSTGLTNPELSIVMKEVGIRKNTDGILADNAEPKSIKELRNLGWLVLPCKKGADYKRAAAQFLRSLTIHIVQGSTNLVKEISTWSWKRDKQRKILPIVADGNDHLIDALIYRVYQTRIRVGLA